MKELIISLLLGICVLTIGVVKYYEFDDSKISSKTSYDDKMPCVALNDAILKYAKKYGIPVNIAYNVARVETGYLGPFHYRYRPDQISSAGAVGPMQVMPATADWIRPKYGKNKINKEQLLSNIDINVETAMMLLRNRYELRQNWKIVLGEYNTGYPIVNVYAIKGVTLDPINYMIKPNI